jgi:phage terminase large subunit-like protein
MAPATARFYEAVVNGQLTHSGDSRLARHIGNAVLREDARGARLAKERRDSPRRIDAAVAAVMAHAGRRPGRHRPRQHLHLSPPRPLASPA